MIGLVDEEVADEATGSADHDPSAAAGWIVVVVALP